MVSRRIKRIKKSAPKVDADPINIKPINNNNNNENITPSPFKKRNEMRVARLTPQKKSKLSNALKKRIKEFKTTKQMLKQENIRFRYKTYDSKLNESIAYVNMHNIELAHETYEPFSNFNNLITKLNPLRNECAHLIVTKVYADDKLLNDTPFVRISNNINHLSAINKHLGRKKCNATEVLDSSSDNARIEEILKAPKRNASLNNTKNIDIIEDNTPTNNKSLTKSGKKIFKLMLSPKLIKNLTFPTTKNPIDLNCLICEARFDCLVDFQAHRLMHESPKVLKINLRRYTKLPVHMDIDDTEDGHLKLINYANKTKRIKSIADDQVDNLLLKYCGNDVLNKDLQKTAVSRDDAFIDGCSEELPIITTNVAPVEELENIDTNNIQKSVEGLEYTQIDGINQIKHIDKIEMINKGMDSPSIESELDKLSFQVDEISLAGSAQSEIISSEIDKDNSLDDTLIIDEDIDAEIINLKAIETNKPEKIAQSIEETNEIIADSLNNSFETCEQNEPNEDDHYQSLDSIEDDSQSEINNEIGHKSDETIIESGLEKSHDGIICDVVDALEKEIDEIINEREDSEKYKRSVESDVIEALEKENAEITNKSGVTNDLQREKHLENDVKTNESRVTNDLRSDENLGNEKTIEIAEALEISNEETTIESDVNKAFEKDEIIIESGEDLRNVQNTMENLDNDENDEITIDSDVIEALEEEIITEKYKKKFDNLEIEEKTIQIDEALEKINEETTIDSNVIEALEEEIITEKYTTNFDNLEKEKKAIEIDEEKLQKENEIVGKAIRKDVKALKNNEKTTPQEDLVVCKKLELNMCHGQESPLKKIETNRIEANRISSIMTSNNISEICTPRKRIRSKQIDVHVQTVSGINIINENVLIENDTTNIRDNESDSNISINSDGCSSVKLIEEDITPSPTIVKKTVPYLEIISDTGANCSEDNEPIASSSVVFENETELNDSSDSSDIIIPSSQTSDDDDSGAIKKKLINDTSDDDNLSNSQADVTNCMSNLHMEIKTNKTKSSNTSFGSTEESIRSVVAYFEATMAEGRSEFFKPNKSEVPLQSAVITNEELINMLLPDDEINANGKRQRRSCLVDPEKSVEPKCKRVKFSNEKLVLLNDNSIIEETIDESENDSNKSLH